MRRFGYSCVSTYYDAPVARFITPTRQTKIPYGKSNAPPGSGAFSKEGAKSHAAQKHISLHPL